MARFGRDSVLIKELAGKNASELGVLGLRYDRVRDILKLEKPKRREVSTRLTKRVSIFDRIGILSSVVLRAKLIMQQLYRVPKMRWDDQVPPDIRNEVEEWLKGIEGLERISIPRRYSTDG